MAFLAYLFLSYAFPALLAVVATGVWWGAVRSPWLFAAVAVLCLVGLQSVIAGAWNLGKTMRGTGGFYLEVRPEGWQGALIYEAVGIAVVLACLGIPLLLGLRNALAEP